MAKKQAACSTEGIPADVLAVYKRKKTNASRLKYIEVQLNPRTPNTAANRHAQLLAQINNAFPGYIDIEEMVEQTSFFTKKDVGGTAKVRADVSRGSIADPMAVEADDKAAAAVATATRFDPPDQETVRERARERRRKARRPKRRPKEVVGRKQPPSTKTTGDGEPKKLTVAARQSKKKKAAGPKTEEEGKPTGVTQPEQVEREEQQPTSVDLRKKRDKAEAKELAAQKAREDLGMRGELDGALSDLTTTTGVTWKDAVYTILDMALRQKRSGLSGEQLEAYEEAVAMVTDPDSTNAELLWGKVHIDDTLKVFIDFLADTVLSKTEAQVSDPTFNKHIDLWNLARDHNIFLAALRAVMRPRKGVIPVNPRNPEDWMVELVPSLGDADRKTIVVGEEVVEIVSETAQEYESIEFEEIEEQTYEEALDDTDISDSMINDYADIDIDGRGKIFDDNHKPITKPISLGNAKLWTSVIMGKLNKAATFKWRVYKNVAEMKRKDPDLYAKAVASRPDKNPIPENAAGYAYADRIAIFSDNIATRKQLAFTVAHEAIGHFGLRSVMPEKNFTKMMDDIYAVDRTIRMQADLLVEMRGLDKHEAIEEVLADRAADLHVNIVRRIYNAIKNFLNRLGVEFTDDLTRYFIHHSRRYQRTGQTPDASPYAVLREFKRFDGLQGRAHENTTFHDANEPMARMEGGGYHGMSSRIKSVLRNATSLSTMGEAVKRGAKIVGRVIENIQSLDQLSLRSRPLQELFEILTMEKQHLETLKTRLGEITAWSHSVDLVPGFKRSGEPVPTEAEKAYASLVMPWYNRSRADRVSPTDLKNAPDLAVEKGGRWVRNKAGWDASRKAGHMSMEEMNNKGFEFQKIDDAGRPAVERRGDGSIIYYEGGKEVPNAAKVEDQRGQPKKIMQTKKLVTQDGKAFTVTERVYRIIEEQRLAIDTIAEAVYLDKLNGMRADHEASYEAMQDRFKAIKGREIKAIREVFRIYQELYNEGATLEGMGMKWKQSSKDRARHFVHHAMRLLDGEGANDKRNDWVKGPPAKVIDKKTGEKIDNRDVKNMADFRLKGSHAGKVRSVIKELIELSKDKVGEGIVARKISVELQNMFLLETQITNAELKAKGTIRTAYIPLKRRGRYQVRVAAFVVGNDGKLSEDPVNLPDSMQAELYYTRMDSQQAAKEKTEELSKILNGSKFVEVVLEGGEPATVGFRAMWGVAPQGASLSGSISYDDLASVLVRAGVNISPQDRDKLVQLTASEHSTARDNLKKDWTPGWDPNIIQGIAEHLEQHAHIAAKNLVQNKVNRLMADSERKGDWLGNKKQLKDYQDAFKLARKRGNASAIHEAYRNLSRYQWQFISSAPTREGEGKAYIKMYKEDGTFTLVNGHNKGEQYRTKANNVLAGYNKQQGTPTTGEEMLATQGSWAMSGTAMMHLGGSFAPAIVNMMSIVTHAAPFLATFNPKTGYGGGHGWIAAYYELQKAGHDVGLHRDGFHDITGNAKKLRAIADRLKKKPAGTREHGLLLDEAEMLAELTAEGVLTPNMFNQLSAVARAGKVGGRLSKLADTWMLPFSKTEQYNRRVTALASYRLDKARIQEATGKKTLTSQQRKDLHDRATQAVNYSQGNYDSFNRPAWAQGNVFKYMWMYKQFQVITVQLMRNLHYKDRLKMVGLLVLVSGVKGIPFADDLADLIDTLMQKFNLKWTGIEAELSLALDSVGVPSALVARGFLDYWFGFTASTRLGMGDLIPGTGYFKAGSDHERELQSLFGPVYGAWFGPSGVVSSASTALQYIGEVVGLRDDVTSMGDVLRTGGGFSAIKNYAKGFTLLMDGSVTNARGQIVAKDVGVFAALTQLVGFYPAAATDQYAVIRMTNDARNYAQSIKTGYIDAWLKADSGSERQAINRMVQEWNRDAGGTIFYIRNFLASANKAKRSALLSSSARNLKTLPRTMRPLGEKLTTARGLSTQGIPLGQ